MPYYEDLDTVEGVARLIADIDMAVRDSHRGTRGANFTCWDITLSYGDATLDTSLERRGSLGEPSVTDVLDDLTWAAATYERYDHIDDFIPNVFGHTDYTLEASRAFERCRKAYNWLRDGVGLTQAEFDALCETLTVASYEVTVAAKTLRAEREAVRDLIEKGLEQGIIKVCPDDDGDSRVYIGEHWFWITPPPSEADIVDSIISTFEILTDSDYFADEVAYYTAYLQENVNRFTFDSNQTMMEYGNFPFGGLSAEEFLRQIAGDFEDDFDLEEAAVALVDAVNKVLNSHGVNTTVSGVAFSNLIGSDLDPDELEQEVWDTVDVYEILSCHDVSQPDDLVTAAKDCRNAAGALAQDALGDHEEPER